MIFQQSVNVKLDILIYNNKFVQNVCIFANLAKHLLQIA
jgi:hypothetical protein